MAIENPGNPKDDENFNILRDLISEILEGKVEPGAINFESSFKTDLGTDSLHLIELAEAIEGTFGLDLRDDDEVLATVETVGQLNDFITTKLRDHGAD